MTSVRRASRSRMISVTAVVALALVALTLDTAVSGPQRPAQASGPLSDTNGPGTRVYPAAPPERSTDVASLTRAAVFSPDRGIAVANLTITPGQYYVGYSFEARLESAYAPGTLRCGLVDSNGVEHFIADDPQIITSGSPWREHRGLTTFNLGDVTLGIRCDPDTVGLYRASFRDVSLWVVRMEYGDD